MQEHQPFAVAIGPDRGMSLWIHFRIFRRDEIGYEPCVIIQLRCFPFGQLKLRKVKVGHALDRRRFIIGGIAF